MHFGTTISKGFATRGGDSMRALCWHGKGDIRCDTVPDPSIEDTSLKDGLELYKTFRGKKDGCIKVVFQMS